MHFKRGTDKMENSKIKKLFTEINMTWPKVIIFAVATAAVTAVINLIPALDKTSFKDIAVVFDCWILFAMIIIMNAKTWKEASLKTFVFFLISQPLIYLIEVPFVSMGWEVFGYYSYWFKLTILTLPGAAIAFLVKRQDWLSVAVLSVATGYLGFKAMDDFRIMAGHFPYHMISFIFCILLAICLILVCFDDKKKRAAAIIVFVLVIIVDIAILGLGLKTETYDVQLDEGNWSVEIENSEVATVTFDEDTNTATFTPLSDGNMFAYFTDENGNTRVFNATVNGKSIFVNEVTD